jgi:hypothetical protein
MRRSFLAAPRLQAGTDHRADATQERREPRRHGRRDLLAAAHHAGGPDRPAPEGLRDRARQEPARQDGLPASRSGGVVRQSSHDRALARGDQGSARAPGSPGALKPQSGPGRVRLGALDLDALRLRWRKLLRASAPPPTFPALFSCASSPIASRPTPMATSIARRCAS